MLIAKKRSNKVVFELEKKLQMKRIGLDLTKFTKSRKNQSRPVYGDDPTRLAELAWVGFAYEPS